MQDAGLILGPNDEARWFVLQPGAVFKIGRGNQNTLELRGAAVSRFHALIHSGGGDRFYLYDLGSTNGTFLNGQRVSTPVPLEHGDLIRIGDYEILFDCTEISPRSKTPSVTRETVRAFQMRLITVLVADIRGYTDLAYRIGQARIAEVIGTFNRECGAVLEQLGTWRYKYIGDAVMAVWEHQKELSPSQVFLAALEGFSRMAAIAASLRPRFQLDVPVRIGAGISSGIASVGNLGSGAAADHTAVGDVVNKAFRLESCTKELGCDIAFGEESLSILGPSLNLDGTVQEWIVQLKGYQERSVVYSMSTSSAGEMVDRLRGLGVRLSILDRARIELHDA